MDQACKLGKNQSAQESLLAVYTHSSQFANPIKHRLDFLANTNSGSSASFKTWLARFMVTTIQLYTVMRYQIDIGGRERLFLVLVGINFE